MHNVHEDKPVLMNSRWALSYLRGPLTRQQIMEVMKSRKTQAATSSAAPRPEPVKSTLSPTAATTSIKPPLPPGVNELWLPLKARTTSSAQLIYHPAVAVFGQVSIFDNRLGISSVSDVGHYLELNEDVFGLLWDKSQPISFKVEELDREPRAATPFLSLPPRSISLLKSAEEGYTDYLARTYQLSLWKSAAFEAVSEPGESERDFRVRLSQLARERRDEELEKLRKKYAVRINTLQNQPMMAEQRLQIEQEQYKEKVAQSAISIGATIFGAILGRKSSHLGRATTSARSASRAYYEKMDINRAQQQIENARQRLEEMEQQLQKEANNIASAFDPALESLQTLVLRPKKKDIAIRWSGILWLPFWHLEEGGVEADFVLI